MSKQLHGALVSNASFERVQQLLQLYPEAVKEQDKCRWLPPHKALFFNCSFNIINMTFQAYPWAAEVQNSHGWSPLNIALF